MSSDCGLLVFYFIVELLLLGLDMALLMLYMLLPLHVGFPSQETYKTKLVDIMIPSTLRNFQTQGGKYNRYL
jgi:hypothetical protein